MKSWLSGAFLLIALLGFGFIFGGLFATRILTTSGMGFDQIADALGGFAVGAFVALVAGVLLLRKLGTLPRVVVGAVALLATYASVLYLNATPPNVRRGIPSEVPPPLVEPFSLQLKLGDPLEGPRQDDPSLPWISLRIGSNMSFDYISVVNPDSLCLAPGSMMTADGIARLKELRGILQELSSTTLACGEPCPRCTPVGLSWYLDQERSTANLDAECWRSESALQGLRSLVTSLVTDYASTVTCERR